MAAKHGRLEAALVVPTGNWQVAVNDGLAYNATLAAATTYAGPTELMTAFVAALNAAALAAGSARTWTGSIASGESGTGYATLTISAGANTTLNWTTTTLRDALGWAANLSGAITYTSPSGVLGMWLPDCPISQPFRLGKSGYVQGGFSQTVSPSGVTKTIKTASRTKHPGITWSHVTEARAVQDAEANGIRSFERFVRDCLRGDTGLAYFRPGGDVKIYWDAGAGTATVYHPLAPMDLAGAMEPAIPGGWVGLYRCTWPGGYV